MSKESLKIPLAVVGCDFRVASSRWRSKLILDDQERISIAEDLKRNQAADGLVVLNTCNRNEWIVSSEDPQWAIELLRSWMKKRIGTDPRHPFEPYVFVGEEAAKHVFRVAMGQESLVLGERQISGQLFRAFESARNLNISSRVLNGLGSITGRLVRIAIRRGCIASSASGVHSLAVSYLIKKAVLQQPTKVAVIGLGSIGRRVQGLVEENQQLIPMLCNRTLPSTNDPMSQKVWPIAELGQLLDQVDAAIVCTGSLQPLIGPEQLSKDRSGRPLLLVDIGIPHQVAAFDYPDSVSVVDLDDLVDFHTQHRHDSAPPSEKECESLVLRAAEEFGVFCNQTAFSEILDTVQKHHRQLVFEEIPKLISNRLNYLTEVDRSRLEGDLKNIIFDYTNEVFRTIKETSRRSVEENQCQSEP